MKFKAHQIAQLIGGTILGENEKEVSTFSKIEEATQESICFFANEKYSTYLEETLAGILLVSNSFSHNVPSHTTLIKCENPYEATAKLLAFYQSAISESGIGKMASVHASAVLGEQIYIADFSFISDGVSIGDHTKIFPHVFLGKNVTIGKRVTIHSGVKIYANCVVGDDCILHAGVVLGSDGFGYAPTEDGSFAKIPHVGNVILGSHVEIGANTVVDKATMGSTKILDGSKLDNLVQVAHNVVIGKNTVIAAQVGISGSTKIGNNVMIGGQAGLAGHIHIGDYSKINAQSGVPKNLEAHASVTGSPSWDYRPMLRAQALLRYLPELFQRVKNLENKP
jgi:UDP-3-O-[3-hydroxymyristoyl] glucosamine N-acyltransferase